MSKSEARFDVLICGAGPVGLLVGLGLQRMGISTCIVERLEKCNLPMYGRACTLYPRTLEYLDQYELLDEMLQVGFIARQSVNFDSHGRRNVDRGWHSMFLEMSDSMLPFILNIRLKYSEDIFEVAYKQQGGTLLTGVEMTTLDLADPNGLEYSKVHVKNRASGRESVMESRIIVGADGSKSITRNLAQITSCTQETAMKWVRIDAVIKTDMPDSEVGFGSIESPTHGNVLWVSLDHNRTRVGFALTPEMVEKYGDHMTQEQAVEEAKASLLPFKVEFLQVDWYTVYGLRQSVADHYIKDKIILAGDACHTHSSAAAQGMNTGVHDAMNLTWKLGGVLKGYLKRDVLQTYETERRATAQNLIKLDKAYSTMITGEIPLELKHRGVDVNEILTKAWNESVQFNIGLGVNYDGNLLNVSPTAGVVTTGRRMPDVPLYKPGARLPTRFHELLRSRGEFTVVVFAGEPLITKTGSSSGFETGSLEQLQQVFGPEGSKLLASTTIPLNQITIIAGNKPLSHTALGMPPFGRAYYDHDNSAHMRYGMSVQDGGIVVSRPDTIAGFACRLGEASNVLAYFRALQA